MTEEEWLACTDPQPMLMSIRGKVSDRKVRLFVVGCCRRLLVLTTDERHSNAVEVAERFADGRADLGELLTARGTIGSSELSAVLAHAASMMVWHAADWAVKGARLATDPAVEVVTQSKLSRDVFGNPFCPVTADPRWLASTAVALAQAIYEQRAFDRLPILADALEEAGCDQHDVLAHCRSEGPHVKGCWAVDLVLGKQ